MAGMQTRIRGYAVHVSRPNVHSKYIAQVVGMDGDASMSRIPYALRRMEFHESSSIAMTRMMARVEQYFMVVPDPIDYVH